MTKRKSKGMGRYTFFRPKEGYVDNPLLKRGRNDPCYCPSGKKFKKCCMKKMPKYIPLWIYNDMIKHPERRLEIWFDWYSDEIKSLNKKEVSAKEIPIDESGVTELSPEDVLEDIYPEEDVNAVSN